MLKGFISRGGLAFTCVIALTSLYINGSYAAVFEACPTETGIPEQVPAIPQFDRIILVPGAGAQQTDLYVGPIHWKEYFAEYIPFLTHAGIPFTLHAVSESGDENVQTRIDHLLAEIKKAKKRNERILLLGHSMGGLVSRLVLRDHSIWKTVVGVVAISTPNLGTDLVDAILKTDAKTKWVTTLSKWVGFDITQKEYLEELSYEQASQLYVTDADFDPRMPPVFSIVSMDSIKNLYLGIPLLGVGGQFIENYIKSLPTSMQRKTGIWGTASDGVVGAYSQVWGHCLGVFHGSHAKVLGKALLPGAKSDFREFMSQLTALLKGNNLVQYEISDRPPSITTSL